MEIVVNFAEKYNFKAFLINLIILGLLALSMLFDMFGMIRYMSVGLFFKSIGIIASTIIGGTIGLTTIHLVLWCGCDYFRKATDTKSYF